ncbi:MAG: site-2 protease family protein [Candidatus Bathyarchaeia archaeon]
MASDQEIWVFAITLLVFWLLVYWLSKVIHLEKYGFRINPFFIRYESQRFKAFLYKASEKRRIFWKIFSNLSIVVGSGLVIFAFFFLSENLSKFIISLISSLISGEVGGGGVGGGTPVVPIIPGVTLHLYWLPYLLLAIVIAAVMHEVSHGIVALVEGVNVKSAGAFFMAIFPGGFVEPNEEELEKSPTTSKLRIISAGSTINVLSGVLAFLILSTIFIQTSSGIVIIDVSKDGPLERVGLRRWDVIYSLNGTAIRSIYDVAVFMVNVTPGEKLILGTSKGNISLNAACDPADPKRAIIGILSPALPYYPSRLGLGSFFDVQLYLSLNWMFIIFVNLAIFNMLPVPFFDGDKFIQYLFRRFTKEGNTIKKFLNGLSLFLIIANMVLSLRSGLFPF